MFTLTVFCFSFFTVSGVFGAGEEPSVSIGTGGVTGVFYPAGGAIASIVNKKRQEYGIQCEVKPTEGSVYNINALIEGTLDFALVQSDRQFQAVRGKAEWRDKGPQKNLRAMFSLYSEACTLCAAVDSGIMNISDLKGKNVNLGNPGSGHLQNSLDALAMAGLREKDLNIFHAKASEAPRLLQRREIDAFFYTVGHPAGEIINATTGKRKIRIIPMPAVSNQVVAKYPYYVKTRIPIELYPNTANDADIHTFGVKATFVTSAKASNMAAYAIVREIFENLNFFKTLHVAFEGLKKEDMLKGMSAPFHPGALRYYKEAGLIK